MNFKHHFVPLPAVRAFIFIKNGHFVPGGTGRRKEDVDTAGNIIPAGTSGAGRGDRAYLTVQTFS